MSEAPNRSDNPFLAGEPDPSIPLPRATDALVPSAGMDAFRPRMLLTPQEQAALQQAPRRKPGTEITVQAKPVHFGPIPTGAEHMFETYDDGRHGYIYRGGPHGVELHAQVDPASQSPDYAQGTRVLFRRFLPGVSSEQAIRPAQTDAARINRAHGPYGVTSSNSNTVIGDFTASQYGRRVGDRRTPGYDSGAVSPFLGPLREDDLTPVVRVPPF